MKINIRNGSVQFELSHLILITKTATKYGANCRTILVALLPIILGSMEESLGIT